VGGDILIDSETLLVTDFVNIKIKPTQSFRCVHMLKMHGHLYCISKKIPQQHLCMLACCYISVTKTGQIAHTTLLPCMELFNHSVVHWSVLFSASAYPAMDMYGPNTLYLCSASFRIVKKCRLRRQKGLIKMLQ
jgi:hypothetical protein